ncbi:M23 family metallopeptidase [Microbispora sp. NBC_01389]|uniref:M23 family metallopeptidase n=1 Tax=Microbispora sp. NBC_01389 TaxID=2903584 RepID=UPI003246189C
MRSVTYPLVIVLVIAAPASPSDAARFTGAVLPPNPPPKPSPAPASAPAPSKAPHPPAGPVRAARPTEALPSGTEHSAAAGHPREAERPAAIGYPREPASSRPFRAAGTRLPRGAPRWTWPLSRHARPLRLFDPPAQRWLAGHRGVDLAADPGEEVRAAGPGRAGVAERIAGRGVVTVVHAGGLRTTYLPVRALVRPGEVVAAGQVIGLIEDGAAHCPVSCLHWGLLSDRGLLSERGLSSGRLYLDPLLLFGQGQVRLLPRWAIEQSSDPAYR